MKQKALTIIGIIAVCMLAIFIISLTVEPVKKIIEKNHEEKLNQDTEETPYFNPPGSGTGQGSGTSSSESSQSPPSNQEQHYCSPEDAQAPSCEPIDHPVCGWYDPEQVSCSVGACVRSTFPNECDACRTPHIIYWTEGDCPLHG